MQCNICGKDMWDNRPKKASGEINPKGPDFKCKDKSCNGVVWPAKGKTAFKKPALEQPPAGWNPPHSEPPPPMEEPFTQADVATKLISQDVDRQKLIQWGQAVNLAAKACEGRPVAPTEITALADKFFSVLSNPPWARKAPQPTPADPWDSQL